MTQETFDRLWSEMRLRYPYAKKKDVAYYIATDVEFLINDRWKKKITEECKPLPGSSYVVVPSSIAVLSEVIK